MKSLRLRDEECPPVSSRVQRAASFVQGIFSRGLDSNSPRRFSTKCRAEQLEPRLVLDSTVVFNEIMYNPAGPEETLEWVELYNQQSVNMDLSAWSLGGGVDYTFPEGTVIPGGGYLVIAADPGALEAAGGTSDALGPYVGRLSNAGETLRLLSNNGRQMNEVEYGDGGEWPVGPDGGGVSLAKREQGSASGLVENWTPSGIVGGTPGAENFPNPDDVPRVFTDLIPSSTAARVLVPASAEEVAADWLAPQFDDQAAANWFDATTGIGFDTSDLSPLDNLIDPAGDIETEMAGQNASALIRVPFNVDDPAALDQLAFEINYDDGFVAYLNGTEIARRNAPEGTPAWNATATEELAVSPAPQAEAAASGVLDILSGEPDPTFENNSMLLWYRADAGLGIDGGGNVSLWEDQSTRGNDAVQAVALSQPALNATGLGGGAVVEFDGDDFMAIGGSPTGQQTMLIVYRDTSTQAWVTPLGTTYNGKGGYHGNSDASGIFNPVHTDPATVAGDNYRNGVDIGTGFSAARPASYVIDARVATSPLTQTVTFLGSDNCCGTPPTGRAINGGIAEVLLYDRALEPTELNEVQGYLADKYGISVIDIGEPEPPPPPGPVEDVSAISLNFASGIDPVANIFDMTPEMVAGVVRTNSWNNLRGIGGTVSSLVGNLDEPTSATVTWESNGTWETGLIVSGGDTTMMKSHLDARATGFPAPNDATITVSDLPASYAAGGYDVYVYFDAATDTGAVTAGYTIGDETFWINDTATFDGTYVAATSADRSNPTAGANYAKFSGLTTESFTLLADSDTFRAEVSGIQIVSLSQVSTFSAIIDNLADLVAGTNILAIHGLNLDASDEDFLIRPKLTAREAPASQLALPQIVINEAASATETEFWLEIRNTGPAAVSLDGLILSTSSEEAYVFPAQSLAAGDRLALTESTLGFGAADNDKLYLFAADGDQLLDARSVTGRLRGRSEANDGQWLYPDTPTPGEPNSFSFSEEIVINEILYNARPELATPGTPAQFDVTQLVSLSTAQWRYNATGAGLDSTWPNTPHTAGTGGWSSTTGAGLFGYETTPEALPDVIRTPIIDPEDVSQISYYFETDFVFDGGDNFELLLRYVIDDGAVFYLNGQEVLRTNMPSGPITSSTPALSAASNAASVGPVVISAEALVVGTNRLSVEVHQAHGVTQPSSDLVFGAELVTRVQTAPAIPGEPFADSPEEWIELTNRGSTAVDLSGWSIRDAVSFDFSPGTVIAPGGYLVIARDAAALAADYPEIEIAGSFSGTLSNRGERILLRDAAKNPADEVQYFDKSPWPDQADGLGASLELRSPWADNSAAEAWAASDEGAKTDWTEYTFRRTARADVGPGIWNEFVFGMLDAGEVLIDDVSVIRNPDTAPFELIQNGTFEADTLGGDPDKWRIIGNHQGTVVSDPLNPDGNKVLYLEARDSAEHQSNNAGTTFVGNTPVSNGTTYEVSFRAKWLSGSNQLNSRFYLSRVAVTTILDVPELSGTPGMENSRFEANVGPTYAELSQSTPLPDALEDVTISVTADDPDGIASLTLRWSIDGGPFADLPMSVGADGRYQGTIPGQAASTIVQFYVLGTDTLGATSTFPAAGADSRALIKFDDGQSNPRKTHTLRIIMTTAETNNMFVAQNLMSNDRIGATVIYNNEIFYNVGVRLKGSPFGRTDVARQRSYSLRFPADQLFRGVQQTIHLDGSGRSRFVSNGQDEIISKQVINRAGGNLPSLYDDLIYMIAPRASQSGPVILQLARYTNGFLDESFENGSEGLLYKYEIINRASRTIDGDPESPKNPSPPGWSGTDIRNLGDDKENYRWTFMVKNNRDRDDFDRVIEMAKAFDLTGDALQAATDELMDIDSWMRTFAIESLVGNTDVYTIGAPHNLYLYVRPTDQKVMAFPWDMDNNFNLSPTAGLHGGGNLSKIIELPVNRRVFQGNLLDIINTTYNTEYMSQWTDSYGSLTGQNYSGILDYIGQRSASVLSQLATEFPFEITTADTTVADTAAVIEGRGWINVREVRMAGSDQPLGVTWLDDERWEVSLPLAFGENSFILEAYDYQGDLISSDTINIESTVSLRPVQDFLRITELHYNPDGSDETEFIELKNISSGPTAVTLDLTNVTIADGPSSPYTFTAGRMLDPGEFVLVVKNQLAFTTAYGSVDAALIDGQFEGSLSNSGERIHLLDADAATVLDFTYQDGGDPGEEAWREETDGNGFSLVIADEIGPGDNWDLGAGWRSSSLTGGSPGEDDPLPLTADFNGDGAVDRRDVVTLLAGFGASAGAHRGTGDTNQDRMATLADLATVQVQVGMSPATSPAAAPAAVVVDVSSLVRSAKTTSASRRNVSSPRGIRFSERDVTFAAFVAPTIVYDLSRLFRSRRGRHVSPTVVDAVISEVTDEQAVPFHSRLMPRRSLR